MPTGYTAGVKDGTINDFQEFALLCARNFGALIEMRDDPLNAEIPESFSPQTDYLDRKIEEAQNRISELESMTPSDIEQAANKAWQAHVAIIDERNARAEKERARYEAMLTKAQSWEPPTSHHAGLKEFMIQQLEESIKFDCGRKWETGTQPSPSEWWEKEYSEANRSLNYHTEEQTKAIERARERTAWIRLLRKSLNGQG